MGVATESPVCVAELRPRAKQWTAASVGVFGVLGCGGVAWGVFGGGAPLERWGLAALVGAMGGSVAGIVALSAVWRVEVSGVALTVHTLLGRPVPHAISDVTAVVVVVPEVVGWGLPANAGQGDGAGGLLGLALWPVSVVFGKRAETRADPTTRGGYQVRFRSGPPLELDRRQMLGVDDLVARLPVKPTEAIQ